MGITDGIVVYVVIWWLVVFMVLPWGNQSISDAEVAEGQMPGAPAKPRMLLKAGITTVIATVLFGVVYWLIDSGAVNFRPPGT